MAQDFDWEAASLARGRVATLGPVSIGKCRKFTPAELAAGWGLEEDGVIALLQQAKDGDLDAQSQIDVWAVKMSDMSSPVQVGKSTGNVIQEGDELRLEVTVTEVQRPPQPSIYSSSG